LSAGGGRQDFGEGFEPEEIADAILESALHLGDLQDIDELRERLVSAVNVDGGDPCAGWMVIWWMPVGWGIEHPTAQVPSEAGWNALFVPHGGAYREPHLTLADITQSAADQGVVVLVVDIEECF
jgi:hypothetical protein